MQIIDYVIIVAYLAMNVGIGLYFNKKSKQDTSSYLVADRQIGLSVLVATFLASDIGGGALTGSTGNAFANGIVEIPKMAVVVGIWIILSTCLAKKLNKFGSVGALSAAEILGKTYGRGAQFLGGLCSMLYLVGTGPAMQSIALGTCIHLITGIDMRVGMTIAALIVLFYTYSSGMWGVVMTDYIQFIIMAIGIVSLGFIVFNEAGHWEGIVAAVPATHLKLDTDITYVVKLIFATALPNLIDANRYSRFYAAKDEKTAIRASILVAIPWLCFAITNMTLGLCGRVLLPSDLGQDKVFATLLLTYLPTGLKGLVLVALMAAIMSTSDSYMLTAAGNFTNDIYKTFINPKASDEQMLKTTKYAVLFMGFAGLAMAILIPNIMSVWNFCATAYVGGCFIPMLYAMFGRGRKSYKAAVAAIACGGGFAVAMDLAGFVFLSMPAILWGMVLSGIVLFIGTKLDKNAPCTNLFRA